MQGGAPREPGAAADGPPGAGSGAGSGAGHEARSHRRSGGGGGGGGVMRALWAVCAVWACAGVGAGEGGGGAGGCGVAEYACRGGGCVRLDAYCDGAPQCADGSDEPARCTVCNRTYYGVAGRAYAVSVREAARVPFLCHLTFTAGGGAHGDLVQLAFDEFRVGRYEPGALDGCPDGYMQLAELGRPFTGGSWCGAADGAALYYSETSTVTVSVKLFRARLGEPFGFRLRYKFLAQRDAVVRFGLADAPLERGAVSPGTYCTRTYEECHRKPCRLQSPNYPGMYPRNVTCYWSVRQRAVPTCKHAMISVRQEHAHKMQIKRSIAMASLNKTGRVVRAWRECTGERDRLIVYDGPSTDDPVLVEYCGGDWLPRVTARGPDMLVAFHSSPYSAPPRAHRPAAPLRGFELDVDVVFADSDSLDYAREARRCEFHVKASSSEEDAEGGAGAGSGGGAGGGGAGRGRRGLIRAPAHTLPPNTTCTWTFHGRPGDVVWIYFSSFTHYSLVEARRGDSGERDEEPGGAGGGARSTAPPSPVPTPGEGEEAACAVELRLWDGGSGAGGVGGGDGRLVGRYCDSAPALCARAALANATRAPRPCAPPDGYVSSSGVVSVWARTVPGTATHPLAFALHYEFVDARLAGQPLAPSSPGPSSPGPSSPGPASPGPSSPVPAECARVLRVPGAVWSPRNALWFGRGGARRLRCVFRLEAAGRADLTLTAAAFGADNRCASRLDTRTGRLACVTDPGPGTGPAPGMDEADAGAGADGGELRVPHLWIYDSPWPGYRVPVACLCSWDGAALSVVSLGGALELELGAAVLSAREDHRHLHFRANWSHATHSPAPAGAQHAAPAPAPCAAARRLRPPGQHIHLVYPYDGNRASQCGETPFLLSARGNRSVLVRVWGHELAPGPGLAQGPQPQASAAPDAAPCHTSNRVLVYDAHTARLVSAVCPGAGEGAGAREVRVFSPEWAGGSVSRADGGPGVRPGAALLVVWAAREAGAATVAWMEVWRAAGVGGVGGSNGSGACSHWCGSVSACMAGALWCDGAADCPGGADEAGGARCGAAARLLAALGAPGAAGAAGAVGGALALAVLGAGWARRARGRRADKRLLGALGAGAGLGAGGRRLTEELLYDASRASTAS